MKKHYFKNLIEKSIITTLLFSSWVFYSQVTVSQTFNYTGSAQTFTVPFGVTSVTVQAWGAGGGGAGGNTNTARGGGGGGAYSRGTRAVTSGQVYNITIGQGGAGTGNPGSTGGDSFFSFSGTNIVLAKGGNGGNGTAGGTGGQASAGLPATGGTRTSGGNGGTGSTNGGGGGGSAGTGGNGGTGSNGSTGSGGNGGTAGSGTGGSPGAVGGSGGTRSGFFIYAAGAGNSGIVPGSGGGGRSSGTGNSTTNGGTGASGRIIITYVVNSVELQVTQTTSNSNPSVGEAVTFTITAHNNKSLAASEVVLTDLLPSGYTFISASQSAYNKNTGIWNIGTLNGNSTTTLIITGIVKDTGVYNNTASIASISMPDDEIPANNTVTANITVCKGGAIAPPIKE